VAITCNDLTVSGWTEIEISGGLDRAPAIFSLAVTEQSPGVLKPIAINPGDPCTVTIGGDLVLTGYVNRVDRSITAAGHAVRVSGRSRLQDLVDCHATPASLSINSQSVGSVARELVAPFVGITVQLPDGDGLGLDYSTGVNWQETPWEIITEIATYEGLLVHDDAHGDLIICKVGSTKMASGFAEGVNVQSVDATAADDMLFSTYIPVLNAQDSLAMTGPGGNRAGSPVTDPLVKRYRPYVEVSDQPRQGQQLAQQRAVWDATRRRGRSRQIDLTCDSWRDSAGTLWTHNVLAPVDIPSVYVSGVEWIIASWTFIRNAQAGTLAKLTLMSPDAFSVEPTSLTNSASMVAQRERQIAIGEANTSGPGSALTAPNAGANGNVRAGEGYGL
jgi:prophage tail gpP-like protein